MPPDPSQFPELLVSNRFYLELTLTGSQGTVDATFLECQGFKLSQDVAEICEVTPQKWAKASSGKVMRTKVPGNVKAENIVLRRGMTNSPTLWKWFSQVESGKWGEELKEGSLVIYNQAAQEQARFDFRNAYPVRYSASDLSAKSSEMEIEELEISVELFTRSK